MKEKLVLSAEVTSTVRLITGSHGWEQGRCHCSRLSSLLAGPVSIPMYRNSAQAPGPILLSRFGSQEAALGTGSVTAPILAGLFVVQMPQPVKHHLQIIWQLHHHRTLSET